MSLKLSMLLTVVLLEIFFRRLTAGLFASSSHLIFGIQQSDTYDSGELSHRRNDLVEIEPEFPSAEQTQPMNPNPHAVSLPCQFQQG